MANEVIEIGRLLRSGITGFVVGCRVSEIATPRFGSLVVAPLGEMQVYGIIYDIHIDDDGLVRQLVTANVVDTEIVKDSRENRNVPIEMSVMTVGYHDGDKVWHLLPPRAPLSLDTIRQCTDAEIFAFTGTGRFGYFRHILRNADLPVSEILAAHVQQAQAVHTAKGKAAWGNAAAKELITLLRDDYPTLMNVLSALGDALPG